MKNKPQSVGPICSYVHLLLDIVLMTLLTSSARPSIQLVVSLLLRSLTVGWLALDRALHTAPRDKHTPARCVNKNESLSFSDNRQCNRQCILPVLRKRFHFYGNKLNCLINIKLTRCLLCEYVPVVVCSGPGTI